MKFFSKYRGPLAAGAILFASSGIWAWFYWDAIMDRERHQDLRMATSLAAVLAPLFDPETVSAAGSDEALARLVETKLKLRQPIVYAVVSSGERRLVSLGKIPDDIPEPLKPGVADGGRIQIISVPIGREPSPGPPENEGNLPPPRDPSAPPPPPRPPKNDGFFGGKPPPARLINWEWRTDRPAGQLSLVLGVKTDLAPHIMSKNIPGIIFALLVGWAGIAAMMVAWYRSIRSRDLARALDEERRERNRLEELNLAAAGLAHETKNPLGIILGLAQRIERNSDNAPEIQEAAEHIIDAADRATARISDFLGFARERKPKPEATDASELLPRIAAALKSDFDDAGVRLAATAPKLSIECDPGMMEQVIVNLLLNSLNASGKGTAVELAIERRGSAAVLTVKDHGRGISPELMRDLFKPYVTTQADGHGLGLAIVRRIVDQHGWTVNVESTVGVGTRVSISGIEISRGGRPAE